MSTAREASENLFTVYPNRDSLSSSSLLFRAAKVSLPPPFILRRLSETDPLPNRECPWGARPQNSGWSLIRCGGVFFLFLTAYYVVRQEAPNDLFLKGSSRETRATQGRSDSDQRSPSRLSHCPIP